MKYFFAAAAVALAAFSLTAPRADAGLEISIGFHQTYVSDHADCGCPIYTRRVCRGYDHCRRPIFDYYREPFHCGCHHRNHPPGHAYGHHKHKAPKCHQYKEPKHYKYKKPKHHKHKKCK